MNWLIWTSSALLVLSGVTGLPCCKKVRSLRIALEEAQEAKREIDDFLLQFSHSLSTPNGLREAMNTICQYVADQVGAESVAIYDYTHGELTACGVYGAFPLLRSKNQKLLTRLRHLHEALKLDKIAITDDNFIGNVAKRNAFDSVADGSQDPRFADTINPISLGGIMATPLVLDSVLRGVLVAVNNRRELTAPFYPRQVTQFQHIAPQVVLMQELVHSYSEMSRRERIDQELEFARQIQFSLLPAAFPAWEQFSINAFTHPAKEVNGDFYDFVEIDDERLLIVIGDACGKGVPACMLTAMTRSFIRAMADNFTTLGDFLVHLNSKLYQDTESERFVTLSCCLLDKKNSLLEFGRAGHTELITFVHNHLRVIYPEGAALGILPQDFAHFDTFCLAFEQGMSFLLFSDGITEAVNAHGEEYGLERLKEVFKNSLQRGDDAPEVIDHIFTEAKNFSPDQIDDQTVILIQYI